MTCHSSTLWIEPVIEWLPGQLEQQWECLSRAHHRKTQNRAVINIALGRGCRWARSSEQASAPCFCFYDTGSCFVTQVDVQTCAPPASSYSVPCLQVCIAIHAFYKVSSSSSFFFLIIIIKKMNSYNFSRFLLLYLGIEPRACAASMQLYQQTMPLLKVEYVAPDNVEPPGCIPGWPWIYRKPTCPTSPS